ncbi:MAG: hypothetical protein NT075_06785 [Chloroflexi bacterium]|nr:hypothetical protein [Chloroflexota bacterium]
MFNLQRPSSFVTRFWTQRQQERAFTEAIQTIYPRWATRNRYWANAFFDEHFLLHRAAPLLAQYQLGKPGTESSQLANQWADQFRFNALRRQQLVDELTPVAANFLYLLKVEFNAREEQTRQGHWVLRLSDWTTRANGSKHYDN